jgi:hypothetical protein
LNFVEETKKMKHNSLFSYIAIEHCEEFFEPTSKPTEPTPFGPGSVERIEVYSQRLMRGEELYHEQDEMKSATIDDQRAMIDYVMTRYRQRKQCK